MTDQKKYADIIERLVTRANIRRSITSRKSVQEGAPDRIADLLDEAAVEIMRLQGERAQLLDYCKANSLAEIGEIIEAQREALSKIADPRLRDHKEPDAYTQLGCVMNIANEALEEK